MIRACWLAIRPKTLPAAIVPVWCGCVLSWKLSGEFNQSLAWATLLGAILIQMATNCFNDAIDARSGADTEKRLGPRRVTASGMLSFKQVMAMGAGFVLLATLCGGYLYLHRGWPVLAIGVPSLILAYAYTGGPFPLASNGLGEVFVLLFFGWVAVAGTVFMQMGTWPIESWLLGAQVGLLSAVLISINAFRDQAEDAATGKRTLAVRLGPKWMLLILWLEIKLTVFVGLLWAPLGLPMWVLAGGVIWLLGIRILWGVMTQPPGPSMNRLLALAGVQLILFAAAFHGLALIKM